MPLFPQQKLTKLLIVTISICNFCQAEPKDVFTGIKKLIEAGINYIIPRDSTHTDSVIYLEYQTISETDILTQPVESITELVSLQPGCRPSGTVFYLDGFRLQNPLVGYDGQSTVYYHEPGQNASLGLELPALALHNMEVYCSGFPSEFSNARIAVINLITKKTASKHTGRIRVTDEGTYLTSLQSVDEKEWYIDVPIHDNPGLSLPADTNLVNSYGDTVDVLGGRIILDGDEYDAAGIDQVHMESELGYVKGRRAYTNSTPIWTDRRGAYKSRKYSFNMVGPLMAGAHYAISGEYLDRSRGLFENQSRNTFNVLAKLTYNMSSNTKLNLSMIASKQEYGLYDYNYAKYAGGYLPGYGPLYATLDMLPDRFKNSLLLTGVLAHSLSANSYLTVTLGSYNSEYEQKRKDYDDRDGDGDRDEYLVYKKIDVKSGDGSNPTVEQEYRYTTEDGDLVYIWTQNPTKLDSLHANYDTSYAGEWKIGNEDLLASNDVWTEANPVGWKEIWVAEYDLYVETWSWTSQWLFVNGDNEREETGAAHDDLDEKIFQVIDSWFGAYGDAYSYSNMKSSVKTVKVDYSSQIHPVHFIQAGAEFQLYNLDVFNLRAFSISNFYLDEWLTTPTEWGLYFSDKIELGGLIVNAGVRFDSYNLGDDVEYSGVADDPTQLPVDETGGIVDPKNWKDDVGAKIYFSPRLGISYPITNRNVFHFSYNHLLQRPDWRFFFKNLGYSMGGAYEEIGNPKLEPQRTISYEVGFTHQFTDNMKVDLTAYYQDIFGWSQKSKGGDLAATHIWYYDNADFGNAKGFELALDKRMSNNFSLLINYTYLITSGRSSDSHLSGSYLWRKLISPHEGHLLDYDQTHTLNTAISIYIPPSSNLLVLFGDWRI
ncbi:MAG: hypothetical protein H8E14_15155, partial [Candidatus Marinimicrobia bacterium]|nr:hypothetical protein [Candidatus Neomarinimicrobiota bacterium]